MAFVSFQFPVFALVAIAALRICRPGIGKKFVLCLINIVFIFSFVSSPIEGIPFFAFIALGYFATLLAARFQYSVVVWPLILLIVAIFVWLKRYSIVMALPGLHFVFITVGLSYVLFRVLHLLIDVAQRAVRIPTVLDYFIYTTFFLTFVSGPIELYGSFAEQMRQPVIPMTRDTLDRGLRRTLIGYLYLLALAVPLASLNGVLRTAFYAAWNEHALLHATANYSAAASVYLVYLYINFVAYMDIVIGIGELAGFSLPENFNKPYNAANFVDLWNRWHITLSQWFKFYLFNPLLKAMAARWGSRDVTNYLGAAAYFVTFGVMGLWHGTTGVFVIYGLALGLGATINKLWQIVLTNRLGKDGYRTLGRRSWYQHLARSSTLAYFAIAVTCLWIAPTQVGMFANPIAWLCTVGAFVLLTLVGAILAMAQQYLVARQHAIAAAFNTIGSNAFIRRGFSLIDGQGDLVWNISMIFAVLLLSAAVYSFVPEIVYKGY